jgi:hypothetical protein
MKIHQVFEFPKFSIADLATPPGKGTLLSR